MRKATGVLLGTAVIWAGAAVMLSAYARARADEPTAGPGAPKLREPARGFAGTVPAKKAAALAPMVREASAEGDLTGHRALRAEWVADQVAMTDVDLAADSRDIATSAMTATTMVRRPMSTPIVVRKSLVSTVPHGTAIERR